MNAADRLRRIVQAARGDNLERTEHEFRRVQREHTDIQPEGPGRLEADLRYEQKRRAEWQAAADLLEELLQGRGL